MVTKTALSLTHSLRSGNGVMCVLCSKVDVCDVIAGNLADDG